MRHLSIRHESGVNRATSAGELKTLQALMVMINDDFV
jgi:hypothetical protein